MASSRKSKNQPSAPARKPLREHLRSAAVTAFVTAVVTDFVIASLATSRATAHALSPLAMVLVVVGVSAGAGASIAWPNALYAGANDVLTEATVLSCEPGCTGDPKDDPWTPRRLWTSTAVMSALLAVWSLAGAGLVAVALNGKHARFVVMWAALVGISGLSATFVDIVARHRGAHAARTILASPPQSVPLRRRAWRSLAIPVAVIQVAVNAGAAWVLFHDYKTGDRFAQHALTKSVAMADALVIAVVITVIFSFLVTGWGMVDALLGRVELDEPAVQSVSPKSPLGAQGVVYVAIAGLVLGKLAALVLPGTPSLLEVAVVRGIYAGVLAFLTTGIAYVRGAVNARAAMTAESAAAPAAPSAPAPLAAEVIA